MRVAVWALRAIAMEAAGSHCVLVGSKISTDDSSTELRGLSHLL